MPHRPLGSYTLGPGSLSPAEPARPGPAEGPAGTAHPGMARWEAQWMRGATALSPNSVEQVSSPQHRGLCWLLCSEWLLLPRLRLPAQRLPGRPPPRPGSLTRPGTAAPRRARLAPAALTCPEASESGAPDSEWLERRRPPRLPAHPGPAREAPSRRRGCVRGASVFALAPEPLGTSRPCRGRRGRGSGMNADLQEPRAATRPAASEGADGDFAPRGPSESRVQGRVGVRERWPPSLPSAPLPLLPPRT